MKNKKISVYSTPTCPYCLYAKKFFTDKGIVFEDIDVSVNHDKALEMLNKSGQMGVPVIDIDGQIIVGFQPEVFEKLINN